MTSENVSNTGANTIELLLEDTIRIIISRKRLLLLEKDFTQYLYFISKVETDSCKKFSDVKFMIWKIHQIANQRKSTVIISNEDIFGGIIPSATVHYVCNPHEKITIDLPRFILQYIQKGYQALAEFMNQTPPERNFSRFQVNQEILTIEKILESTGVIHRLS